MGVLIIVMLVILIIALHTLSNRADQPGKRVRPRVLRSILSDESEDSHHSHPSRVKELWELLLTKVRKAVKSGSEKTPTSRPSVPAVPVPYSSSRDSGPTASGKESFGTDSDENNIESGAVTFDVTSTAEEESTDTTRGHGKLRAYWFPDLGIEVTPTAPDRHLFVNNLSRVASTVSSEASQLIKRASDKEESVLKGSSLPNFSERGEKVTSVGLPESNGSRTADNYVSISGSDTSLAKLSKNTSARVMSLNRTSSTKIVLVKKQPKENSTPDDFARFSFGAPLPTLLPLRKSNESFFAISELDKNVTSDGYTKYFPTKSQSSAESLKLFSLIDILTHTNDQLNVSVPDNNENFSLSPISGMRKTRGAPGGGVVTDNLDTSGSSTTKDNASESIQLLFSTTNRLKQSVGIFYDPSEIRNMKMTPKDYPSSNGTATELSMGHGMTFTSANKLGDSQNNPAALPHKKTTSTDIVVAASYKDVGLPSSDYRTSLHNATYWNRSDALRFVKSNIFTEGIENKTSHLVFTSTSGTSQEGTNVSSKILESQRHFRRNTIMSGKNNASVNNHGFSKPNGKRVMEVDQRLEPVEDASSFVRKKVVILDHEPQREDVKGTTLYCSIQLKHETSLPSGICTYFVVYNSVNYDATTRTLELVQSALWQTLAKIPLVESRARVLPVIDAISLHDVMQDNPLAKGFATVVARLVDSHSLTGLVFDMSMVTDVNADSHCFILQAGWHSVNFQEAQKYLSKRHFVGLINYCAAEGLFRSNLAKLARAVKNLILRNDPKRVTGIATSVPNPFAASSTRAYSLKKAMQLVETVPSHAWDQRHACLSLSLRVFQYEVVSLGLEPRESIGTGVLASVVDKAVPYSKVCRDYAMTHRTFDEKSISTCISHKELWLGFDDPTTIQMKIERMAQEHDPCCFLIEDIDLDDPVNACKDGAFPRLRAAKAALLRAAKRRTRP
ncbi:unnamed protein product [Ixodes hexagonus]